MANILRGRISTFSGLARRSFCPPSCPLDKLGKMSSRVFRSASHGLATLNQSRSLSPPQAVVVVAEALDCQLIWSSWIPIKWPAIFAPEIGS